MLFQAFRCDTVTAAAPNPHQMQGQLYKLSYVLLSSILAIVTGCNWYCGNVTLIAVSDTINRNPTLTGQRFPRALCNLKRAGPEPRQIAHQSPLTCRRLPSSGLVLANSADFCSD